MKISASILEASAVMCRALSWTSQHSFRQVHVKFVGSTIEFFSDSESLMEKPIGKIDITGEMQ